MHDNSPETAGKMKNKGQDLKVADIDTALQMMQRHMDPQSISGLVSALETLKTEPGNEAYQEDVIKVFNDLGVLQGAALTYAPYLNVFVSDDPFGD